MTKPAPAPPATLVIFGAMGDLARRLLAPALVNLAKDGLLAKETRIIGVSHGEAADADLRQALAEFLDDDGAYAEFRDQITYLQGDFDDPKTFEALASKLDGAAVFYLATAPGFFGPIVDRLADAHLLDETHGFRRVVIEKPFGADLASAQALNGQILKRATEEQVYRIDHFLGKETVQNILVLRFGNPLIEAVWNSRYIDHVQITAAETVTVGTRGKFYDATGALRDMTPNHLFQLLAMVGMEPPNRFDADAIRTEKAKVIAALRPVEPDDAVRGRYGAGEIAGKPVKPYTEERDVDPNGATETYVALKVLVDSWRWSGVPFYLRTGKGLAARSTQVVVQFKDVALALLKDADMAALPPNRLVLQIQPNEGASLEIVAKAPGPVLEAAPVSLDFRYADRFAVGRRTGYETLLYDVLVGDQTLFQRADQIEGGWRAVQPLLDAWAAGGEPEDYAAGSAGPEAADALLARDGRAWRALS